MGKVFIRIILIVLLFLFAILTIFVIKKVKLAKQKNYHDLMSIEESTNANSKKIVKSRNKVIVYIIFAVIILLVINSFYYVEGRIIRFNTLEDSLNYSLVDNSRRENVILESEECYFIFSRISNNSSYHVASKYGEKIGVLDYQSKTKYLGTNKYNDRPINCSAIYDRYSNTSCYFVMCVLPEKETNMILIDGKEAENIYYSQNGISVYALISDGEYKEDIIVTIDGDVLPILSQNEYMLNEIRQSTD